MELFTYIIMEVSLFFATLQKKLSLEVIASAKIRWLIKGQV